MTEKQFCEIVIDGGWKALEPKSFLDMNQMSARTVSEAEAYNRLRDEYIMKCMYLDPDAWKIVGKKLGWEEKKFYPFDPVHVTGEEIPESQWYFRCMGNALWEGRTIGEFLFTIRVPDSILCVQPEPHEGVLLSNPPQYRCKKCVNTWVVGKQRPICRNK